MSKVWSDKIQSTEMLYYSREERFNDENKNKWFDILGIKDGMKILEVGCGGGLFTNMIKKYFPQTQVVGIDLDVNHIEFAITKAKELNLEVNYLVADIQNLPFADNSFDLVFSHTVIEHLPFDNFIAEQKRVLREGGLLKILLVNNAGKKDSPFDYLSNEINDVYSKLVLEDRQGVGVYFDGCDKTLKYLNDYNFKNLQLNFERIIYYSPDLLDKNIAIKQINANYMSGLYNAEFVIRQSKNGDEYYSQLLELLEKKYNKRIEMLQDKKVFDFESTNLIIFTGNK